MTIDSTRTHLRTITFLGAGAAILAVIGYLLMKSDRKKPRRKSSKSSNDSVSNSTDICCEPDQRQETDLINCKSSNQINENFSLQTNLIINNIKNTDLTDEQSVESSSSLLSSSSTFTSSQAGNNINGSSKTDDFEEVDEEDCEEEEEHNKQSTSMTEPDLDKLSDASSDSGNGQSDIVQMYNCLNEYEEDNQNLDNKHDKNANNTTDDDESAEKKTILNNESQPVETVEIKQPEIKQQIETKEPETNPIKTKSKTSTSSLTSSSTSSFQQPQHQHQNKSGKTGKTKNSKINFEPKKSPTHKNNKTEVYDSKHVKHHEALIIEEEIKREDDQTKAENDQDDKKSASVEDLVVYEFNFPRKYCGKLIGKNGVHVDYIRSKTHTQIAVRNDAQVEDLQVVCVSGRLEDVDAALEIISVRFPAQLYPQISFKPISKPIVYRRFNPEKKSLFEQSKVLVASNMFVELSDVMKMKSTDNLANKTKQFDPNTKFSVHVTAIVSGAHVFIQLPTHSTYENLQKLDENMLKAYSDLSEPVPQMTEPIEYGTICAAPTSYGWHRAIITNYQTFDEASMTSFSSLNITDDLASLSCGVATVKFLDYGGYLNIPANQLRQLRSDFMLLPFQAIECYLDGIFPYEGTEESGKTFLSQLIKNSSLEASVTGYSEENIPLVKLFITNDLYKNICVNSELEKYGYVFNTLNINNNYDIHSELNSLDHYQIVQNYDSLPYSSINNQFSI